MYRMRRTILDKLPPAHHSVYLRCSVKGCGIVRTFLNTNDAKAAGWDVALGASLCPSCAKKGSN